MVHLRILSFVPVLFLGRMIVSVDQGSYRGHLVSDWIRVLGYFVFRTRGMFCFLRVALSVMRGLARFPCLLPWANPKAFIMEA